MWEERREGRSVWTVMRMRSQRAPFLESLAEYLGKYKFCRIEVHRGFVENCIRVLLLCMNETKESYVLQEKLDGTSGAAGVAHPTKRRPNN